MKALQIKLFLGALGLVQLRNYRLLTARGNKYLSISIGVQSLEFCGLLISFIFFRSLSGRILGSDKFIEGYT